MGCGASTGVAALLPPSRMVPELDNIDTNDAVRRELYSADCVPLELANAAAAEVAGPFGGADVSFLDHAWGKTPPAALVAAVKRQYGLYSMGNSTWDVLFAEQNKTE